MKRRDFLAYTTSATATLPILAVQPGRAGNKLATTGTIGHVIVDQRFTDARMFGKAMHDLGCSVSCFHGDVTQLWSGRLDLQWQRTAEVTAGQTTKECFFCLAQMAAKHGLYPKLWIEHVTESDGAVRHEINGPIRVAPAAASDLEASDDWRQSLASLFASVDLSVDTPGSNRQVGNMSDFNTYRGRSLVSWIIAPTRQTQLRKMS
jgi:hypothetical protein